MIGVLRAGIPGALAAWLAGLLWFASTLPAAVEDPTTHTDAIVVLTGEGDARSWQQAVNSRYLPNVLTLAIPPGTPKLPGTLDKPAGGPLKAWVCQGVSCLRRPAIDQF